MTSLSFDVKPASALLAAARPSWLDRWGTFAAGLTVSDLPAPAVERAKLVLLDCVGVIAAGMQEPECRALAARLAQEEALLAALAQAQAKMLEGSTHVGMAFADKARAMHLGDEPHTPIHGQASIAEAKALIEEGVPVAPLPLPVVPPEQCN